MVLRMARSMLLLNLFVFCTLDGAVAQQGLDSPEFQCRLKVCEPQRQKQYARAEDDFQFCTSFTSFDVCWGIRSRDLERADVQYAACVKACIKDPWLYLDFAQYLEEVSALEPLGNP